MAHDKEQSKPKPHSPHHPPPHPRPDGSCKGHPLVVNKTVMVREPFDPAMQKFFAKIYGADWRTTFSRSQVYKSSTPVTAKGGTP